MVSSVVAEGGDVSSCFTACNAIPFADCGGFYLRVPPIPDSPLSARNVAGWA